jgi:hypothetical protein
MMAVFLEGTAAHAGIPIPCTATRYLEAPRMPDLADRSGKPVTLYYNVFGCADGKWDGYKAADGSYQKLHTLPAAKLPPAPTFWSAAIGHPTRFWVEWLWIVVGLFVLAGAALAGIAGIGADGRPEAVQPPLRSGRR